MGATFCIHITQKMNCTCFVIYYQVLVVHYYHILILYINFKAIVVGVSRQFNDLHRLLHNILFILI